MVNGSWMTRTTRWIAATGAIPVVMLGWALAGWLTPHLLGSQPRGGWNAYGAYVGVLSDPAWQPHALRIYLAGAMGLGMPVLAFLGCLLLVARRESHDPKRPPLAFAPASWLAKAGYTADASDRIIWGRRSSTWLSANGHAMVASPADGEWQRDFVVPNALHWEGPLLVVDHDGAAWAVTSGHRSTRGPVWCFDPFAAEGKSTAWNPLAGLGDTGDRTAALGRLAKGIYASAPAHIRSVAAEAFIAVAGYLLDAHADASAGNLQPPFPTLGDVEQLLRAPGRSQKQEFKRYADKPFTAATTRAALQRFIRMPRDRFDYVMSIASRPLKEVATPRVRAALSGRGLDLDAWASGVGTLYVVRRTGTPGSAEWLVENLLERALQALLARKAADTALCILDRPGLCGELPSLPRTLYEAGARRVRVLQRCEGLSDWTQAYGEDVAQRMVAAFDLRIFAGPSGSTGVPSRLFDFPSGETTRFEAGRWPTLASHVGEQRSEMLVALQRGIERPIRANTLRYAKDPRLAARRLPPAEVSPPYGDDAVPSKTLISLGATAALALGATAYTVGGKGAQGDGKPAMQAPVYSDKLVESKIGPTTFAFPMNLYEKQVGPDFQGNVSLMVRWPNLDAFPPNAANEDRFREAYMDESIGIRPEYIDKVPIESLLLRYVTATYVDEDDPLERLSERTKGTPVFGLTPYYADLTKVAAYFRARDYPSSHDRLLEVSDDWFFAYDDSGEIATFIKCANHEIKGAGLIDGKLEWTPPGQNRGDCRHSFVIPRYNLVVHITYLRAYLRDWKRIETRVRQLIEVAEKRGGAM